MGFNVLIVEDSRASRELLAATVEACAVGVRVIHASGGFEALKLLPRNRFDLIITDLHMPDINGLELINFVKRNPRYRTTPLFIITAEGHPAERERGIALGAAEFLVKPVPTDTLSSLVRRYLRLE
jgi:two-component system chemotaxis response regulator CheY